MSLRRECVFVVPGGGSGAAGTPGEGFEGTVGNYLQQHHYTLQQQNQLQQLQHIHQFQQQQFLQYQQQQVSGTNTVHLCSVILEPQMSRLGKSELRKYNYVTGFQQNTKSKIIT